MDVRESILICLKAVRQECRTNLEFLCREVLGFKDVNRKVHGPLLDALQKFPGGEDKVVNGKLVYTPYKQLWQLEGSRQNLFLYPRGHLKTTIISIAHSIQAALNYPNVRVLISVATADQRDKVMEGILSQFRYNKFFRELFPEFCPEEGKQADFGSFEKIKVPNRTDFTLKEPTFWTITAGKTIAGGRADFIKHSDLVDEQNVLTATGIKNITSHFRHSDPLRERYNARDGYPASVGWVDVEGTTYDFGDLYHELMKLGTYHTVRESADPRDREDKQPLWPERFPAIELQRLEAEITETIYAAQYRLKCVVEGDGLCDENDIVYVPAKVISEIMPRLRVHCTIDAAGTDPAKRGDNWAITVGGFDQDGRPYILEVYCRRYPPEEVIDLLFDIYRRFPRLIDFKMEAEANALMLLPYLSREQAKRGVYLPIVPIKRDTATTKQTRIRGLRPFFKKGLIRFNEGISKRVKEMIRQEIVRFPSQSSGVHDDILDTLADMMQNRESDGVCYDLYPDADVDVLSQFGRPKPRDRFLGFGEDGIAQWLYGPDMEPTRQRRPTGII